MIRHVFYLFTMFLFVSSSFSIPNIYKLLFYNSIIPPNIELRDRVLTTVYCNDCDTLPKVENAGKVINFGEHDYQIMHNGLKIFKDCYYGHWMTILIENLKGHHEPQEEKIFHEVLKYIPKRSVMIELGSYWGYYSMWFQQQIPNAQNYLIEPDPKNIEIGKQHFNLNNMIGHFTQAMIGSHNAENQLFIDWDYNKHQIRQICIDDFAIEHGLSFIHILHSDIQGAEVEMLKGCKTLIEQKRIGYFFISTHRGTHKKCLKILQDANFEILISITRKESFSADGLIVAKLPDIPSPNNLEISRRSELLCNLIDSVSNNKG